MADRFTLTIKLGNEAMRARSHVRRALIAVTNRLQTDGDSGAVMDENGNKVGEWEFATDDAECVHCGEPFPSAGLLPLCPKCTRMHYREVCR